MSWIKNLLRFFPFSNKAFRIVLIYFILSALWIFFTDKFTFIFFADHADQNLVSLIKGWFFIIVTSLLIYRMIHKELLHEKKNQEKLSEHEQYNRTLFNQSPIGLAINSIDGNFVDVNPAFTNIIGRTIEESLQLNFRDILPQNYFMLEQKRIEEIRSKGYYDAYEMEYIHKNGHLVPIRLHGIAIERDSKKFVLSAIEDITEQRKSNEVILRANRVYNVISQINQAIFRIRERNELFEEVCKIVVEYGKFRMAWIGLVDPKGTAIKPIKWYGHEEGYFSQVDKISFDKKLQSHGQIGEAIKKDHYFLCNDIANDPFMIPWREEALYRDYHSFVAIPIKVHRNVVVAFSIYATVPFFFNDKEINLLTEVLDNIGYALEMIESEEHRKRTEEALVRSEEKFYKAFYNSPDAIAITRLSDGLFTDVNESLLRLTGYKREEIIGRSSLELKLWENDSDRDKCIQAILSPERVNDLEINFRKKNGDIVSTIVSGEFITLNGETHLIVIVHDISDRKRAEQLLIESEENFRTIFEYSPFALVSWNNEAKILFWNTAAEKLFGWNRDEVIGKKFTDFFVPEYEKKFVMNTVQKLINNIPCVSSVNENLRKDGTVILCEWSNAIIHDRNGNPNTIISVAKDVTEQVKLQKEINESHKQMRALASYLQNVREEERVAIAREMHDELGQILSSIKMNLVLIQRQVAAKNHYEDSVKVNSEFDSLNKLIDRAVMRVRKLITQLRPELLDKLGLIPALEWYVEEFTKETKLECEFLTEYEEISLDKNIELTIFRTVQESLTNALKHSGAGRIIVKFYSEDVSLVTEIIDNGCGINTDEISGGKSFGLLGMRERANMIGGKISITGIPNKGTTIRLVFKPTHEQKK